MKHLKYASGLLILSLIIACNRGPDIPAEPICSRVNLPINAGLVQSYEVVKEKYPLGPDTDDYQLYPNAYQIDIQAPTALDFATRSHTAMQIIQNEVNHTNATINQVFVNFLPNDGERYGYVVNLTHGVIYYDSSDPDYMDYNLHAQVQKKAMSPKERAYSVKRRNAWKSTKDKEKRQLAYEELYQEFGFTEDTAPAVDIIPTASEFKRTDWECL